MRTFKRAVPSALVTMPMLVFMGLMAVESIAPRAALAGNQPAGGGVVDSSAAGVDGNFAPGNDDAGSGAGVVTPAAVRGAIAAELRSMQSTQSVTSITGASIALTAEQISNLSAAFSSSGGTQAAALSALETQLAAELGGDLSLEISILASNPENLSMAIAAANSLINGLTSQQLNAALNSPTFLAVRQILAGAVEASDGDALIEGGGVAGIPLLSLSR